MGESGRMITVDEFMYFADVALDGMVGIVEEMGDDEANRRPGLPGANSPYAILTHCLGVMEYWGGEMIAGREIVRDREAEFVAVGGVGELVGRVRAARGTLLRDLETLEPAEPPRGTPRDRDLETPMGRTQGGVVLHIYEELAQHHGQMQLTHDLLRAG